MHAETLGCALPPSLGTGGEGWPLRLCSGRLRSDFSLLKLDSVRSHPRSGPFLTAVEVCVPTALGSAVENA